MGDCNGDTAIHSAAERGRLEVRVSFVDHSLRIVAVSGALKSDGICFHLVHCLLGSWCRCFASSLIGFLHWIF